MTSIKDAILISDMDFHIDELKEQLAARDAEIAQLRAQVAQLSEKLNDVPVFAIDRYMDNSEANEQYYDSVEGNADIYLIRKWLDGDA